MSHSSKKVIYAAFFANLLIAITKFTAAFLTNSSAMFSEGIHSLVDTGNQVLLLLGLKRAKMPANTDHPFGHGKEIYFWSFVVAVMVFAIGAGISIYEGIQRILEPEHIVRPHVNYIVLGLAFIFESGSWWVALKEFRLEKGTMGYIEGVKRGKDPTKFTVLLEDSAALLGIVVAFLGILLGEITGIIYFDGVASLTIGLILAVTAFLLALETKGLLIGESADSDVERKIRNMVGRFSQVKMVNEVLTLHMGPDYILVNMSVDFQDSLKAGDVEEAIAQMNREIKTTFPQVKRVFIEAGEKRS